LPGRTNGKEFFVTQFEKLPQEKATRRNKINNYVKNFYDKNPEM